MAVFVRELSDHAAAFRFRRHQPSRLPPAKIRPGRPAPAMGPGTATSSTVTVVLAAGVLTATPPNEPKKFVVMDVTEESVSALVSPTSFGIEKEREAVQLAPAARLPLNVHVPAFNAKEPGKSLPSPVILTDAAIPKLVIAWLDVLVAV